MNIISDIFGWPLGLIAYALFSVLKNYGAVLIIFTLITRVILFPITLKQQKSSAKMQLFQPKIQELQKKYANNKQKLQEETMKLYSEEGYNPMSGCLPQLIQFPFLFGIINVVYNPLKHFLRIPADLIKSATDILGQINTQITDSGGAILFNTKNAELEIIRAVQGGSADKFAVLGQDFIDKVSKFDMSFFGIDLGVIPTLGFNASMIIPVLSALFAFLSLFLTTRLTPLQNPNGPQMGCLNNGMMIFMPIFSFYLSFSFPLGIGLYWMAGSMVAILQVFVIRKFFNPQNLLEKMRLEAEEKKQNRVVVQEVEVKEDGTKELKEEKLSLKEANRRKLAQARKKMAEKYGDVYHDEEN